MQLTFHEIEQAFGIEEKALYQWLNTLGMPAVMADGLYYFNSVEVLEWALKNRITLTPGALELCGKSRHGQDVITPALMRGGVHFSIEGSGRDEVLEKVLDLVPLPAHVQRAPLRDMLLSREQAGTTCIGNGIAIPHVKHPVVFSGMEPVAGLFFLREPVDFQAPDNERVHTLFVILSSSFKGHLSLLSRLAFCLQEPVVQSALGRRAAGEDIIASFQVAESKTTKAP